MSKKLIDVVNSSGAVIHTYPITLPDVDMSGQTDFGAKALEAVHFDKLVPNNEVASLTTRSHQRREGAMEPYDAPFQDLQSIASLEQDVRLKAYSFWELSKHQNRLTDENCTGPFRSIFGREPTSSGNQKGVRRTGVMSIGTEPSDLKLPDVSSRRWLAADNRRTDLAQEPCL